MKKQFVKICPKCGSTDIGIDASDYHVTEYCQTCGLGNMRVSAVKEWWALGTFPEIDALKVEGFRKMLKREKAKSIKGARG